MKSESVLLITSAQNDLLDPTGGAWNFVRGTVEKNNVPKKLNELIRAARESGIPLIHSPIELDYLAMVGFKPLSAIQQVVLDNKLLAKGTAVVSFSPGSNRIVTLSWRESSRLIGLIPHRQMSRLALRQTGRLGTRWLHGHRKNPA